MKLIKNYEFLLLDLVSKELNHLAAILHAYAGGFEFYEVKKKIFFKKKIEIFYTFYHFYSENSTNLLL